jgi:Family of unknown function (DUF6492)
MQSGSNEASDQPLIGSDQSTAWAIITPSYRGDFERCKLLCESMDAFVTGAWHHYIIVEKIDLKMFSALQSLRRTIIEMESLLPKWLHHLTTFSFINNRSIWFSFRTRFMIGWQVQQLVKMEMAFRVEEQGLLYCDSDVFFIRPFDVSTFSSDSKFRFYSTIHKFPREDAPNPTYMIAASKQLGLGAEPFPCPSYIDNMVTWHAPTVRAMCDHIQQTSRKDWKAALGRNFIISEYSLYGLYVDQILPDQSNFQPTTQSICKTAWSGTAMNATELDTFCDSLLPAQVAVGFQSFLGVSVQDLSLQLQRAIKQQAMPANV